jgi:hypothetical protein
MDVAWGVSPAGGSRRMGLDAASKVCDVMLLARHKPEVKPLFKVLEPHIPPTNLKELQKIVSEEQPRGARAKDRFTN